MQEQLIRLSSYLFLAGVLLVFLTIVPAVRERFPRAFGLGFLVAVASVVLVLVAAVFFD
ncbi:MAG: hypothetical protein GX560_04030 [Deinococcales bacterium]|nr:hypothetical protein [Deinococcales bacterium]